MLILIIESSSEKGCLILAENDQVLATTKLCGGPELSRGLAQEVKNILSTQVPDLVAVGTGPGSYTGIRVGVALAKALSYGWKVPCLGFSSLKAFGPPPHLVPDPTLLAKCVWTQFSEEGAPPFSLNYRTLP